MNEISPRLHDSLDEQEMAQLKALSQHTVVELDGTKYLLVITKGKKISVTITAERLVDIIHIDEASGHFISLKKRVDLLFALLAQISQSTEKSISSSSPMKAGSPKPENKSSQLPASVVRKLRDWMNRSGFDAPVSQLKY